MASEAERPCTVPLDCWEEKMAETRRNHETSTELLNGHYVGRDPRDMAITELRSMGHQQMTPMEAIRAKCLDCCGDSPHEVRLCTAVTCPSWPFRMGRNPWRPPPSEERREELRRRGLALARSRLGISDE